MTETRKQLNDLGEWLGIDAVKYINTVQLFDQLSQMAGRGDTDAAYMINALRDIHRIVEKA